MWFGELLKQFRDDAKPRVSQHALSKQSGIGQSRISDLETGKTQDISIEEAKSLAKGLGLLPIDTEKLLIATGKVSADELNTEFQSAWALQSVLLFHHLSPSDLTSLETDIVTMLDAYKQLSSNDQKNRHQTNPEILRQVAEIRNKTETRFAGINAKLALSEANAALHLHDAEVAQQLLNSVYVQSVLTKPEFVEIQGNYHLIQGDVHQISGRWDTAEEYYEKARSIFGRMHQDTDSCRARRKIAEILIMKGDFDTARIHLYTALDRFELTDNQYEKARTLVDYAWLDSVDMRRTDHLSKAEKHLQEALRVATSLNNGYLSMLVAAGTGQVCRSRQDYPNAHKHFQESFEIAKYRKDERGEAWALLGRGRTAHKWAHEDEKRGKTEDASAKYLLAVQDLLESAKIFQNIRFRYRYNLALLLLGQTLLQSCNCIDGPKLLVIMDDLRIEMGREPTPDLKSAIRRRSRALLERALIGFVSMKCRYYESKTRHLCCELLRIEIEDTLPKNKYSIADVDMSDQSSDRRRIVQEKLQNIEEHIAHISRLNRDNVHPQYLARSYIEFALANIRIGQLRPSVELISAALFCASDTNDDLCVEVENRLNEILTKVIIPSEVRWFDSNELQKLSKRQYAASIHIAEAFCEEIEKELQKEHQQNSYEQRKYRNIQKYLEILPKKLLAIRGRRQLPQAFSVG